MASNRLRRVAKELADIQNDTGSKILAEAADGGDLTHLRASFPGPPDTPYEGGTYIVDIKIPQEYPFRPPQMSFKTKLWHPNVSSQTVRMNLATDVMFPVNRLRVPYVSTRWGPHGHQSSQSSLPCSLYSPSSAHQNQRILKMQRLQACS